MKELYHLCAVPLDYPMSPLYILCKGHSPENLVYKNLIHVNHYFRYGQPDYKGDLCQDCVNHKDLGLYALHYVATKDDPPSRSDTYKWPVTADVLSNSYTFKL